MASLREKRDSRFWWACVTGPDGKQKQFSTGLTDKGEAFAVAVAAEQALRRNVGSPHQLRKALDHLAETYTPATETDPPTWLVQWAEDKAREVSNRTAGKYAQTIREAAEWLTEAGVRSFGKLTPGRMTELRNHWSQANGASTVTLKMKILRGALAAAVKAKLLADNPAEDVAALRKEETRRREFRPEELEILVPSLTGEWKGMFFLGLYTGQRLNDLAELCW
ncbi:MAG: phage integrase SAM-like domain-containing protein, partial [Verrucomicrobiota bacterium]